MEKSIWTKDLEDQDYRSLDEDIETDVLVIGGGICGILCAYYMSKVGKQVVVVDSQKIGSRKTLKTTAAITALQDTMYCDLINSIGIENTKLYLNANLEAIEEYRKLSKEFDFDFENVSSYKYDVTDGSKLVAEVEALKKLGFQANFTNISLPIAYKKAIEFKNQAQMNPLKLIYHLKNHFKIYEHTTILKIKHQTAYTKNHQIKANYIIVCTGYPFLRFKGGYFIKETQEKSYVIATKNEFDFCGNAIGTNKNDFYFRNYKDYILIGGLQHKPGKKINGIKTIQSFISNDNEVEYVWENQDCITLDALPYIGKYDDKDNIYLATGFNLWGMTGSMISAKLIADLIEGRFNSYEKLFSPNRRLKLKPLLSNGVSACKEMVSFKTPRCTHMGCALHWNSINQTYECTCHGSKYDKDGHIIDGPAIKDLRL